MRLRVGTGNGNGTIQTAFAIIQTAHHTEMITRDKIRTAPAAKTISTGIICAVNKMPQMGQGSLGRGGGGGWGGGVSMLIRTLLVKIFGG